MDDVVLGARNGLGCVVSSDCASVVVVAVVFVGVQMALSAGCCAVAWMICVHHVHSLNSCNDRNENDDCPPCLSYAPREDDHPASCDGCWQRTGSGDCGQCCFVYQDYADNHYLNDDDYADDDDDGLSLSNPR